MGLFDIHKPYRIPILERLARDGDDYAMFALSWCLRLEPKGGKGPAAGRWRRRAERTLLTAQLEVVPYCLRADGTPRRLSPVHLAWVRRAARLRHPQGLHAHAWTLRSRPARRAALARAARAGSSRAAYDLAMRVQTLAGDIRFVRRWLGVAVVVGMHEQWDESAEALVSTSGSFLKRFRANADAWRRRAAGGDPEGLLLLGYARRFGRGASYDPVGARRAWEAAWKRGCAEAALPLALGSCEHGSSMSPRTAAMWAERAAATGDPLALAVAGDMTSMATPALKRRAVGWLKRAAGAGQPRAAHRLACGHAYGGFVPQDLPESQRWARVAADAGHEGGMSLLARLLEEKAHPTPGERREATAWRRRAAACGNYDDWTNYGVRLHEGKGVRRNDREAVRWYRRAAAQGCESAMANLGRCYRDGHGVRKSPRLAARWFRRAAEVFDSPQAAWCLGRMYLSGDLGKPDASRAFRWFRRAAAGGDADALSDLGVAYHSGRGVTKDREFAALLYRAAADAGDGWGAYCLGQCYRDGEGVRRSRRSAERWFGVAIERDVKPARKDLERLRAVHPAPKRSRA